MEFVLLGAVIGVVTVFVVVRWAVSLMKYLSGAMRVVEFSDGTFGVRSYWFFGWRYLWLSTSYNHTEWVNGATFLSFCKGSEEKAEYTKQYYSPVKVVK